MKNWCKSFLIPSFNFKLISWVIFFRKGALHLLSDKATLESVIEAIENGTAEVEAAKMESDPKSAETADNPNAIPTPEEVELKKKQMEDRIKQRRKEIEGKPDINSMYFRLISASTLSL